MTHANHRPHRTRRLSARARAVVGLSDQLLYSGGNFALTVLVARSSSASQFGAFALILSAYVTLLAMMRGLASEPLVVRFSDAPDDRARRAAGAVSGSALVIALTFSLIALAGSLWLGGTLRHLTLAMAALFPGLVLQDNLRYIALARKRPGVALLSDAITTVVQFGLTGALLVTHRASATLLVISWGIGAYLGGFVAASALRTWPRPRLLRWWFRENGSLAYRLAADDLASQGSQQATSFVVAATTGLSDAGGLRAGQTVYGPPSILNLGVQVAVLPELIRVLGRSARKMRRYAIYVGLAMGSVGALWMAASLASPDSVGHALFGPSWRLAKPLLVYFGIAQIATGLRIAPMVGLRALGAADRTLVARIVGLGIGFAVSIAGAIVDGPVGVAIASAIVTPVQAAIWWWQFDIAYRDQLRVRGMQRRDEAWQRLLLSAGSTDQGMGGIML